MPEQTMIQIRMDNELKEKAAEVFDAIGIDIPTAVRMFFKAAVREGGLPFKAVAASGMRPLSDQPQLVPDMQPERETEGKNKADELMGFIRSRIVYETPGKELDEKTIFLMPMGYNGEVAPQMYVQLLTKVPAGYVTRWEDMREFLGNLYGEKLYREPSASFPQMDASGTEIPYWKIVSFKGVLTESILCSRDHQKRMLEEDGISVSQRGKMKGSYKVDDYKKILFDYNTLRVIKNPEQ